ncbi:hypothetical protein [Mahella australiensis]|uniref:RNA binding protein Jsn1, putative n=1 Tax=Mahella australiensis (strain DSM 15567 / CIP 107919 / 50-1 BON) TaxID=697281 RepID=F3ZZY0_MAHA5|nr:hypothetical protein [Mahella australiensis]AEE95798.1 RNA binding protein Jsn1, putative [Mahella australiensis 50-1 BON]
MVRYELFDGTKTYMFPNGALATPETIRSQFPAVDTFPHLLELNGNVVQAVMEFGAVKGIYQIDESLSDEEAIAEITYKANNPPPPEPTADERIAAALEYQNIMSMPDEGV